MVLSLFPCGIKMLCLRQMKLIRQGVSVCGRVCVCVWVCVYVWVYWLKGAAGLIILFCHFYSFTLYNVYFWRGFYCKNREIEDIDSH